MNIYIYIIYDSCCFTCAWLTWPHSNQRLHVQHDECLLLFVPKALLASPQAVAVPSSKIAPQDMWVEKYAKSKPQLAGGFNASEKY